MNWMTRIAILFGRKKFEEFAQANPQLPDDALAVANTLDTYPTRGAAALIAGSLAHAADNVLRGTETVDQLATHALLILAALCIIWVRHAISKHDVKLNAVVQKARTATGISSTVTTLMILFVPFVFFVVNAANCRAGAPPADVSTTATGAVALQTGTTNTPLNCRAGAPPADVSTTATGAVALQTGTTNTPLNCRAGAPPADVSTTATGAVALQTGTTNTPLNCRAGAPPADVSTTATGAVALQTGTTNTPLNCRAGAPPADVSTTATGAVALQTGTTNTLALFTQFVSDFGSVTKFSSGVGVNLHGKVAPLLSQELSLFGHSTSNSSWSTGPSHATFFLPAANEEQLGWSFSGSWDSPPKILRFALFNASDIDWTVNWGLPVEDYYRVFRRIDWRENRLGVSITRKF